VLVGLFAGSVYQLGEPAAAGDAFVAGFGWEHADHAGVAAERDALEAVFGFAAGVRPDGWSEADHVLGDFDAERFGGDQVPGFVCGDGAADAKGGEQHSEEVRHGELSRFR